MQALFRNPIVEPGLVGTSSGAAFGAALFYVFGALLKLNLGGWTLPLARAPAEWFPPTLFLRLRIQT